MSLSPALQQLANRYNELVGQFSAGDITEADAMSMLSALSTRDATGAVWAIAPQGHFTRANGAGDAPQPADPGQYADQDTPRPPTPAFPSPSTMFADHDLDTPPEPHSFAPAEDWSASPEEPAHRPGPSGPHKRSQAPARSLNETPGPRKRPAFLNAILGFFTNNKAFAIILIAGLVIVAAAVIVPKLSSGDGAKMPTTSTAPGAALPGAAPVVTADAPTALDAANVITTLESGTPAQIQALISAQLDAVTLLRTQALWAGVAHSSVTVSPATAASSGAGTAAQVWTLTREGDPTAIASVPVAWIVDGATWKLTAPPAF